MSSSCFGATQFGPSLQRIGDTLVDLSKCKHPELFEYMQKFNRVIPKEYLELLGMVVPEDNGPRPDPRIKEMTAHFVENCSLGYTVHSVTPYMSTEYPYCRWIVFYLATIDRDYRSSSPPLEFYLLSVSKPRQVYPIINPNDYHNYNVFLDKRIEYGVKECSCPKPTFEFAYEFNLRYRRQLRHVLD